MDATRNCEYCHEPFTPTPGPMAAKQRFCCTKHRIYANRAAAKPDVTAGSDPGPDHEQHEQQLRKTKAKTRRLKQQLKGYRTGDYFKLLRLKAEISQLCMVLECYDIREYDVGQDAFQWEAIGIYDDLITLGEWFDRTIAFTEAHLSETKRRATIEKLRNVLDHGPDR